MASGVDGGRLKFKRRAVCKDVPSVAMITGIGVAELRLSELLGY